MKDKIISTLIILVLVFYITLALSFETADAGRADELRRYENNEVICYSRHYHDSSIVCK